MVSRQACSGHRYCHCVEGNSSVCNIAGLPSHIDLWETGRGKNDREQDGVVRIEGVREGEGERERERELRE